jgi:hypothetical protein
MALEGGSNQRGCVSFWEVAITYSPRSYTFNARGAAFVTFNTADLAI